ncbi:hypothetical protein EIQ27_18050 [Xanthomonas campestris pv. armoraciae]|nr:hypothetical protein D0A41_04480 [Xanthomonas campestris]RFF59063.1 hypothetical protein D0A36_12685 [Xanthomonas campestris]
MIGNAFAAKVAPTRWLAACSSAAAAQRALRTSDRRCRRCLGRGCVSSSAMHQPWTASVGAALAARALPIRC